MTGYRRLELAWSHDTHRIDREESGSFGLWHQPAGREGQICRFHTFLCGLEMNSRESLLALFLRILSCKISTKNDAAGGHVSILIEVRSTFDDDVSKLHTKFLRIRIACDKTPSYFGVRSIPLGGWYDETTLTHRTPDVDVEQSPTRQPPRRLISDFLMSFVSSEGVPCRAWTPGTSVNRARGTQPAVSPCRNQYVFRHLLLEAITGRFCPTMTPLELLTRAGTGWRGAGRTD